MDRRRFFQWLSCLLGAAFVAFLAIPGVKFLRAPLREARRSAKRRRMARLDELEVGVPRKVVVVDQRVDAWTRYPEGPIGAVWLLRRENDLVEAYSSTCPHLGCAVQHVPAGGHFYCPCHEAKFADNGTVVSGPAQRGLDALKVVTETDGDETWVSVMFEKFELGTAEKRSLG